MARVMVELPFLVPLDDGEYELNVMGTTVSIRHTVVAQEHLDPRLGIAGGYLLAWP